jgi:Coenzyme PQQ synthesis protein D (PqqD)
LNKSVPIALDSIVYATADQVSCDLDGEAAILNLRNGTYFGLDPIGAFIWKQLVQPQSVGSIAAAMLEHYDVEPERCQNDLLALLHQLDERGLLEIRPAAGDPSNGDDRSG